MSRNPKREAEETLAQLRATRNRARAGFAGRVEKLRGEMSAEALTTRILKDLTYRTSGVVGQAVEIASDNRGVLIGALAALGLWATRRSLGGGVVGRTLTGWGAKLGKGLGQKLSQKLGTSFLGKLAKRGDQPQAGPS